MKYILLISILLLNTNTFTQEIITEPVIKLGIGLNYSLACSPDGRFIATGGRKDVFLWNHQTMELVRTFAGHQAEVNSLAFSHDGNYLATVSWDTTARLWEVETGKEILTIDLNKNFRKIIFSPDDKILLTTDYDMTTILTDVQTGNRIAEYQGVVHTISADGTMCLISDWDKLMLRNIISGIDEKEFYTNGYVIINFLLEEDSKILYYSDYGNLYLIDIATGVDVRQFSITQDVNQPEALAALILSTDEKTLVSSFADDHMTQVWDMQTGSLLHTLDGHIYPMQSLNFSADGNEILTMGRDAVINVWDRESGQLLSTDSPHSNFGHVSWSPDGTSILTGGRESFVQQWDAKSYQPLQQFSGLKGGTSSVNYSPDGSLVAVGSFDDHCYIWDNVSGDLIQTLPHADDVNKVAFSPDGKQIVTANEDGSILVWEVGSDVPVRTLTHPGILQSLDFSPDGLLFATGGTDGQVRVWDAASGELVYLLKNHEETITSIDFSPDSNWLVSSDYSGLVIIWDMQTGEINQVYFEPAVYLQINGPVIFSPDGNYLAWGVPGMEIHLIDLNAHEMVRVFQITDYGESWFFTSSLSFSPDGQFLLSGHQDGIARVWETGIATKVQDWSVF